ncbi:MAG: ribonuclease BN [Bacteroidetes bacterium]|nr:MAG: ribonuclease BN [Bacteroidota bacterium]
MISEKVIAVVIPCYNEESQIHGVIGSLPDYVDHIVIIDDKSTDNSVELLENLSEANSKIILIKHEVNKGNGAARISGLKKCLDLEPDIICLLDGDGQMDIKSLRGLIDPVLAGKSDIMKGNRFFSGEAWKQMPRIRYFGNAILSLMTKIVSGYWHIADFQSGYIVVNRKAIELIPLDHLYRDYGFPNDLLIHANVYGLRVSDHPVKPIYNVGEKSGINLLSLIPKLSWLLFSRFFWRMKEKYVIRDFHPLVFFYLFGMGLLMLSIPLMARFFYKWYTTLDVPPITALALIFVLISGFQFIFFAMWFDMSYNQGKSE